MVLILSQMKMLQVGITPKLLKMLNKYEAVVPFYEYSNASKMIRSKPNNIDTAQNISLNKQNYFDTNYSKSFEVCKGTKDLQKLSKNNITLEQHKN